jgi:Flp pilus assembly protein TadG
MLSFSAIGKRFAEKCQAFVRNRSGMLPVVFAVAIVPTLALVGTAIDYAGARHSRAALQSAADAAVLEAVMTAEKLETSQGKTNDFKRDDVAYQPIKAARDLFDYLASETKSVGDVTFALEVERKGPKFTARGQYKPVPANKGIERTASALER